MFTKCIFLRLVAFIVIINCNMEVIFCSLILGLNAE